MELLKINKLLNVGAVTAVVGNWHFCLTEVGHLLNSTATYKTVSSNIDLYANIFECDANVACLGQNLCQTCGHCRYFVRNFNFYRNSLYVKGRNKLKAEEGHDRQVKTEGMYKGCLEGDQDLHSSY